MPYFNNLNFIFGHDDAAGLQDGTCDLLLPSADLGDQADALGQAGAQVSYAPEGSWEHLDFGVQPVGFDDGFNVFHDSPDFFSDVRMRQAVAMCVDRQALVDQLAWGQGSLPSSYVQPDHPLVDNSVAAYDFDPAAANALLDQIGWVMGPDGLRLDQSYPGAQVDTPLELTLYTSDTAQDQAMAKIIQSSLDDCGIQVDITSGAADQVFASGPFGPVFGRNFQLAIFAWPYGSQPACYLYLSEAIPGQDLSTFKYGWGGWNISGWSNADYDAACKAAMSSLPGEAGYGDAERHAQAIFAEQLPALPLFLPYEAAAARADFCGFSTSAGSELLQNIEGYGYAEWCQ